MKDEQLPRLVLEWCDPPEPPDAEWWWLQVLGGLHRLVEVRERLERVSRMRHAEKAVMEFRAALDLYWWHCYAVRERAVELLGARAGDRAAAGRLKKVSARSAALAALNAKTPSLAKRVGYLVGVLDSAVVRRNQHTHRIYVGLALDTGSDSFDPEDVIDEAGPGAAGRRMRRLVASAVRRKARACAEHLQLVIECLSDLAMGERIPDASSRGSHRLKITQVTLP